MIPASLDETRVIWTPVKVTSRLAEAKTSWALASGLFDLNTKWPKSGYILLSHRCDPVFPLSLISFAFYYRFTIVYIVISLYRLYLSSQLVSQVGPLLYLHQVLPPISRGGVNIPRLLHYRLDFCH